MMTDHEKAPQGNPEAYLREEYGRGRASLWTLAALILLLIPLAGFAARMTPDEDPLNKQISMALGLGEDRGSPVLGMMDIEEAWAIEDAREEAQEPLVSRMFNGEDILGRDALSQTYYCTLGLDNADSWPEVCLSAQGAQGVQVAWIDDYGYDAVADALSEGCRYELLAYTDTQYEYIGVVFTGLPIVTMHTDGEAKVVKAPDVGADVHIADARHAAILSRVQVHTRGGDWLVGAEKCSYRFEFRGISARGKEQQTARSVLGMRADSDWLLIANPTDQTAVRNHLCWSLWRDWQPGRQLAELESRLVEVFVNDAYQGIYQLMQYVDPVREMLAVGANPQTDVCIRRIVKQNQGDRPRRVPDPENGLTLELRYAPPGMSEDEAFSVFAPYIQVDVGCDELDDEAFAAMIMRHFDISQVLEYFLFVQGYCLRDNILNNLYIWALRQEDGTYRYVLSPWDMDRSLSLTIKREPGQVPDDSTAAAEDEQNNAGWFQWGMKYVHRMLDLDVGGCRQTLWTLWTDKRTHQLSDDTLYQQILELEEMINASGAYLRESEAWQDGAQKLDLTEMSANIQNCVRWVEFMLKEIWPAENMPDWW